MSVSRQRCGWHLWLVVALVFGGVSLAEGAPPPSFECLIKPMQVVQLRSPTEGLIEKILVDRGDTVTKGEKLVELQSDAERSAVAAARFRAKMEGRILAARNRLSDAEKKLERSRMLVKQKFVSVEKSDQAETEKQLAKAELQQALEDRELASLSYRHAVDQLNLRTLRSPLNGVVVKRMLNPGDLAESGTDRKPILRLAQIDPLRVEVVLPETVYGKIHVGMVGKVTPEDLGGSYTAHVTVVDRVIDAASGTLGVRLELPNPQGKLPVGLRCHVEFPALHGIAASSNGNPR